MAFNAGLVYLTPRSSADDSIKELVQSWRCNLGFVIPNNSA